MGITERRQAEKELIRQKIYDATSEIILSEGYEKLSIRKIAAKIEYSPGVIYNYFRDKKAIIEAIITENYDRICRQIEALKLEEMKPKEALKKGLISFVYFMIENPEHYRAIMLSGLDLSLFNEKEISGPDPKEILIHVLQVGKQTGVFEVEDEENAASLLLIAMSGLINTIVSERMTEEEKIKKMIESYVGILVKGVVKGE